ncbi:glycosyltransferase [Acidiferrobacter sp.]|uniref:glycosyltransferase n=1 Tax=Acidiferrobacter sp. TaxID=1872107 RepID=UPI0026149BFC|nr:glycosyltransferase [Acidiferrobacter sp.]
MNRVGLRDQVRIIVSVISHGQGAQIARLFADIAAVCHTPVHVVLTINRPEPLPDLAPPFPVTVVRNTAVRGFAANHNAAAAAVPSDIFCVVNPDVRLMRDPFAPLVAALEDPDVGVAVPLVVGSAGDEQDSMRSWPTPWTTVRRFVAGARPADRGEDWAAGMFMAFRTATFEAIGGFDPRYHLYYEDCDLCCRLRLAGLRVQRADAAVVIHDGQRASHRRLRYFLWHVQSALRFFRSAAYRKLRARRARSS